ncbi:MAG: hypothetical protein Kow0029_28030 [Candidatus Rifleibacteriota bacterium]
MSAIEFHNLGKSFGSGSGQIKALDSVNLTVPDNSIFGLVGLNGAGKTTAIKILLGLLNEDAGEARIFGCTAQKINPVRFGFAPEIADLPDYLSVEEIMAYSCFLMGCSLTSQRLGEILQLLEIEKLREVRVNHLSKGNRQRVSLAAAIAHDPDLLVFDEPTTGLDPIGRRLVKSLLRKLKEKGKTVLFTTHILTDLKEICDNLAILHSGKVVFQGTIADFTKTIGDKSLEEGFEKMISDFENSSRESSK